MRESESEGKEFNAIGVPVEAGSLKKPGYTSVAKLKEVNKPGKLHQETMGSRKKNKIEIQIVAVEQVTSCVKK